MGEGPWRVVTFDLDGTLTLVHGWRFLARQRGKESNFESTNRRFFAGEISEDEHLRNLLGLAVGMSVGEVEAVLRATPVLPGIAETIEALHAKGIEVDLLTHNPGYICDWYRGKFGFDHAEGTSGADVVDGHVAPVGTVVADKSAGLDRIVRRLDISPRAVLHVGDGSADTVIFAKVGAGIALNCRIDSVRRAADVVLEADDLRTILPVIGRLEPRHR